MVGPWGKLARLLIKEATKKPAKMVKRDVAKANTFKPELQNDLSDLAERDNGVSASWIEGLIKRSHSPKDLDQIRIYLADSSRTSNLPPRIHNSLFDKLADKLEMLEQQAVMKHIMEHKDKIIKLLDDIL